MSESRSRQEARAPVLIVSNEPETKDTLARACSSAGHVLTVATTGKDGLARFQESGIDVLIVDAALPALDGFSLAFIARQAPVCFQQPIIGLTRDLNDEPAMKWAGADRVLLKPATPGVLAHTIRSLLDAKASRPIVPVRVAFLRP